MRLAALTAIPLLLASVAWAGSSWQERVEQELGLLGHRNWIAVVDSAYPLQVSPGVVTIETNADQLAVVGQILKDLAGSRHIRPIIFEDKELSFVPEADAPGVKRYRADLGKLLSGLPVHATPHEEIIRQVDEAGKTFRVLVLKTNLTIPYTSVFLQLDCRYWSAASEKKLRQSMH